MSSTLPHWYAPFIGPSTSFRSGDWHTTHTAATYNHREGVRWGVSRTVHPSAGGGSTWRRLTIADTMKPMPASLPMWANPNSWPI